MKKFLALAIVLAMFLAPTIALAGSPWAMSESYGDKVTGKLEFGLKNLLGGWTELYNQPKTAMESGAANIPLGIGKGLLNFVVYTLGGAIHTVTFPIPVDVPIPNGGLQL